MNTTSILFLFFPSANDLLSLTRALRLNEVVVTGRESAGLMDLIRGVCIGNPRRDNEIWVEQSGRGREAARRRRRRTTATSHSGEAAL